MSDEAKKRIKLDLQRAGHAVLMGGPSAKYSYAKCQTLISYQKELLEDGVPYSITKEYELHDAVTDYINRCIINITHMQKAGLISKQEFPIEHDLLRFYRDFYHHEDTQYFRPFQTKSGYRFLIWPVLDQIPAVNTRYKDEMQEYVKTELDELLKNNQIYMEKLINEAKGELSKLNVEVKFRDQYPMAVVGGGGFE